MGFIKSIHLQFVLGGLHNIQITPRINEEFYIYTPDSIELEFYSQFS